MKIPRNLLPVLCAIFVFSSCQKETSLETGSTFGGLAVGSLKDSSGNCFPMSVRGTYKVDSTLRDSNYVLIQFNVTTPGAYKIVSDSMNGFFFKDSGFIATTGLKTLKLKGIGKPVSGIQSIFTISFGSASCSFSVDASGGGTGGGGGGGSNPNLSDTAWQFTEGTKNFRGYFDTVYTEVVTGYGNFLVFEGYTSASMDTSLEMAILLPGSTVQPGTYFTATTAFFAVDGDVNTLYEADPTTMGVNLQIVITSYNAATKIVTGTLGGTSKTGSGGIATISNGRFRARLN